MHERRIATEAIDEGLDRKHLFDLRQRFQEVNRERLARTHSALSDRQQQFLSLLPLLFHTSHPMLPGYISHQTPCGIAGYTPGKSELRLAQGLARSFKWKRDPNQPRDIEALFVMGSVGTVAHSDSSDLDFWVCYQPGLATARIRELGRKCQLLTEQAAHIGLEAHFFLMDCEGFKRGETSTLDSESSGSAQHYLLLDEFYRTALHLAGREPLWWMVPAACESHYRNYADILVGRRFLNSREVLDFGGTDGIPAGEYVGAGIWQLYKAIESPYKSVLKLMLLESYANDHPAERALSLQFKQRIYNGELDVDELDPYVMVYRRLETYLLQRGETKRLELLRRCLYFKVNKPLTRAHRGRHKSWQRQLLERLVREWGWSREQLYLLDARPHWKASQVIFERKLLVSELTRSYRFLVEFARQTGVEAAIDNEELNVLGRKLYAAFDRKAGKIDWINPGISPDLGEQNLSLVATPATEGRKPVWNAYTQPLREQPFAPDAAVKQSPHLGELLLWCHCNGLLTAETQIDIDGVAPTPLVTQLRPAVKALQQWLPLPLPPVAHEAFQIPARTRRLLLLVNLGRDPQQRLQKQGIHRLSNHSDPLDYSALKENQVACIEWISLNSWNEVSSCRFGDRALLSSLLHYLREIPSGRERSGRDQAPPQLSVHCLSHSRSSSIAQRVEELFRDVTACYYSATRPLNSRYIFAMAGHYHALQFVDGEPRAQCLKTEEELITHLGQAQSSYSPLMIDRHCLKHSPLVAIARAPAEAAVNVYYHLSGKEADIYVLDEHGSLFHCRQPFHDQQSLLRPLHRFIRAVNERQEWQKPPTERVLSKPPVAFYELVTHREQQTTTAVGQIEPRAVTTDLNRLRFFDVQVIAELGEDGGHRFNFYCDQQEFCEWEWGEDLFHAVSRYVLSQRRSAEPYPCYITDLDLSQCKQTLATGGPLQTVHYLQIKAQLEAKLNSALSQG